MSRYYTFITFILLFTGCAVKSASDFVAPPLSKNSVNNNFNEADLYLIYALDAEYRGEHETASRYYEKLYDVNNEPLYIREAIRNLILSKKYREIKRLLDKSLPKYPNDETLKRYLAAYYIDTHQYKEAQKILKTLVLKKGNASDKTLLASVQLGLGQTEEALSYFEEAYQKEKNAKTLIPLVNLLYYKLEKKEKAKKLLNSHIDFIDCDEAICYKLLEIYERERDLKGLSKTAEKLYAKTKNLSLGKTILKTYFYEKDYDKAISFLEKSKIDDEALLELYLLKKSFKKAATLAKKLYHDTQDLHFLAQMAMIEYESSPNPSSKKVLKSVQKKFEKVLTTLDDASYNNFYGYILIDHDINVSKGIKLVKKALSKESNAPYYIDSLAWGYYKQNACQKAYDTIYPIMIMVKEPEIKEHYEKIKACKEGKK